MSKQLKVRDTQIRRRLPCNHRSTKSYGLYPLENGNNILVDRRLSDFGDLQDYVVGTTSLSTMSLSLIDF